MDPSNPYLSYLHELVDQFFKDEKVKVVLFGSQALHTASSASDVDLGLISEGPFNPSKLALFREKVENSNIPLKVEVVDLSEVSTDFRREALRGAITWKE